MFKVVPSEPPFREQPYADAIDERPVGADILDLNSAVGPAQKYAMPPAHAGAGDHDFTISSPANCSNALKRKLVQVAIGEAYGRA